MKQAMVSELKARLSHYLTLVRRGQTVIVRDRKTPIAKLVPYRSSPAGIRLIPASVPPQEIAAIAPVTLSKQVDLVGLLRRDRDAG